LHRTQRDNAQNTDFRTLVDAHQERVRNTCFRFVDDVEDAEDLTQEVFVRVHESLGHFREEAEISTWIYRIAVNTSLDFIRKRKRKKRFAWLVSLDSPAAQEHELPAAGDGPLDALVRSERRQILQRAIDRLPENQRIAIVLNKYEDFSAPDIASIMAISLTAAEALLHRARRNLHTLLYRYFEERA
jgi:RNA polymerase sigma-70 factor, ECF subfamily